MRVCMCKNDESLRKTKKLKKIVSRDVWEYDGGKLIKYY